MPVCITFDTERNYFGHLANQKLGYQDKNFSMLEIAVPKLLQIGEEYQVPFTFFLCGEVAENCRGLFSNLPRHAIGVHTHPFTHDDLFRSKDINSHADDLLASYDFPEQYQMIFRDYQMVSTNLNVKPRAFRAGKFSANQDTFAALDRVGLSIDCSQYPTFQVIGWRPFKIAGTAVWEIPTYCEFSPEVTSYLGKLMRVSALAESLTHNIYIGYIHPMILGNPHVKQDLLFDRFRGMIENWLRWGFTFWTIEQALDESKGTGTVCNLVGKTASAVLTPPVYLARKWFLK